MSLQNIMGYWSISKLIIDCNDLIAIGSAIYEMNLACLGIVYLTLFYHASCSF